MRLNRSLALLAVVRWGVASEAVCSTAARLHSSSPTLPKMRLHTCTRTAGRSLPTRSTTTAAVRRISRMGMTATDTFVRAGAARRTVMTIFRRLCCSTTDPAMVNGQIRRSNGHAKGGRDRICSETEIYILWGESGGHLVTPLVGPSYFCDVGLEQIPWRTA